MGLILPHTVPPDEQPTQPALLIRSGAAAGVSRGSYSYVAIVKALPGELEAIRHLDARQWRRVTPLVEVTAGRARKRDQSHTLNRSKLPSLPRRLQESFGLEHAFFLDFPWLRSDARISLPKGPTVRAVPFVIDSCMSQGLSFIPVLRPGASDLAVELGHEVAALGRGLGVRYAFADVAWSTGDGIWDEVLRLVERAKTQPELVDLVLDLGYISPRPGFTTDDVLRALALLPDVHRWRSLALAGTSIPSSLADIAEDTVGEIVRQEWLAWRALGTQQPERLPAFADYGIQHPSRPPMVMRRPSMRANLRYTSGDRFLMARGRPLKDVGVGQYRALCRTLRALPSFRGPRYSWGDAEIDSCANGGPLDGGQRHWRAVGTSHHITQVVEDLERVEPSGRVAG